MTEQYQDDDPTLAALFGAARNQAGPLPEDLFARIMADAQAVDTARAAPETALSRPGWFAGFGAMLGGWPSFAGLATAAVAGVWIGVAQPAALDSFGPIFGTSETSYELDDLMPVFDFLASEG